MSPSPQLAEQEAAGPPSSAAPLRLPGVAISDHAVSRWLHRVGAPSYHAALIAVAAFVASGKVSGRAPRWAWSRGGEGHGTRYVTNPACGGVCVVSVDGCAITVITRSSTKVIRRYEAESVAVGRRKAMA